MINEDKQEVSVGQRIQPNAKIESKQNFPKFCVLFRIWE